MRKILLSLAAMMVAIVASAQVVFDFDNDYETLLPNVPGVSSGSGQTYVSDGDFTTDQVVTLDGVTVTIKASAEDAPTPNRLWTSSPRLRMYNESFTISAASGNVVAVEFEAKSTNFNLATEVGTLEGTSWTGAAPAVTFSVVKNTQIKKITVTVDATDAPQPEEGDLITFEGDYFTALIDDAQYFGSQLYGDGSYNWTDATTTLSSELIDLYGDGMFWGGGVAISNYVNADYSGADYNRQLEVASSNGNFAVVYGDYSYVYFNNAAPRTIKSMKIAPTNYLLDVMKNGNDFAAKLEGDADAWFRVTITNENGDAVEAYLCRDGVVQEGWKTIDLSSLGESIMLTFTFSGSDASMWGLNTPTYCAIDDILVAPMSEDVATAVTTVQSHNGASQAIYDLQGRRVSAAQHGIYIINGRKVLK